jgi:DNA-binding NarL/FixJ family response regulator
VKPIMQADSRESTKERTGILVTGDLTFSTKIVGTARSLGLEMAVVGSADAALEQIRLAAPQCVILDLALSGLSAEVMARIVEAAGGARVIAFGSHVDSARLHSARDAGCFEVMPRSRFAMTLSELLQRHLGTSQ